MVEVNSWYPIKKCINDKATSFVFARPRAISMFKPKLAFAAVMLKTITLEISSETSMQPYKRVASRLSSKPQPIVLSTDDLR